MRWSIFALAVCASSSYTARITAQTVEPETVQEFLAVVPEIVRTVPAPLLQNRPLLIDLRSFVLAGSSITGHDLNAESVRRAIGREFRDIPAAVAITRKSEHRYEVLDDGVHLRLDGLSRDGNRYSVFITYLFTEVRGVQSALGMTQVYLTFRKHGQRWELQDRIVLSTS